MLSWIVDLAWIVDAEGREKLIATNGSWSGCRRAGDRCHRGFGKVAGHAGQELRFRPVAKRRDALPRKPAVGDGGATLQDEITGRGGQGQIRAIGLFKLINLY